MKLFRPDLENPGPDDMKVVGQLMHTLPIGWVEPEDIANAVLFLASDEARLHHRRHAADRRRQLPQVTIASSCRFRRDGRRSMRNG